MGIEKPRHFRGLRRLKMERLESRWLLKTPIVLDELLPEAGGDGGDGFVLIGEQARDGFGSTIAGGDFNGDGRADLLVGTSQVEPRGRAYVIFGVPNPQPAFRAPGQLAGELGFQLADVTGSTRIGAVVANAGDLNEDGIDDLIIDDRVVFGRGRRDEGVFDLNALDGQNGFRVVRPGTTSSASVIPLGDFDGDGISDLLVKGRTSDEAHVILGSPALAGATTPAEFSIAQLDGTNGTTIEVGTSATVVFRPLGDVDGDGRQDLATTTKNGFAQILYGRPITAAILEVESADRVTQLRTGDGPSFSLPSIREIGAAGDLNHDGVDDLFVSLNSNPREVRVVFGKVGGLGDSLLAASLDGRNGFVIAPGTGVTGSDNSFGQTVASVGDITGDGIDDLVVASPTAGQRRAWAIFGHGGDFSPSIGSDILDGIHGFAIESSLDRLRTGESLAHLGDFNGDGIEDLVVGGSDGSPFGSNDLRGRVSVVLGQDFVAGLPRVSILDSSVNEAADRLRLELNAPWSFPVMAQTDQDPASTRNVGELTLVQMADFNGDGWLDLSVLEEPASALRNGVSAIVVQLNHGDQTFAPGRAWLANKNPSSHTTADVDRDGDVDLIAVSHEDDSLALLLNRGDGTFEPPIHFSAGVNPADIKMVDLDEDQDLDAVVLNNDSSAPGISVLRNLGGGLLDAPQFTATSSVPRHFAIARLNGDELPDLVVLQARNTLSSVEPQVIQLLNNGNGTFRAAGIAKFTSTGAERPDPRRLVAVDFDRDGDIDVLATDLGRPGVWIVPGAGNEAFGAAQFQPLSVAPAGIQAGDLNNDGREDVLLDTGESWLTLGLHVEALQFDFTQQIVAAPSVATARLIDFDSDGDWDILRPIRSTSGKPSFATESLPPQVGVIRNVDGVLTAGHRYSTGARPVDLVMADFNDDGHLDAVTADSGELSSPANSSLTLQLGDGVGGTVGSSVIEMEVRPSAIGAGDFDGDGDIDLAVGLPGEGGLFGGESESPAVGIWRNDGGGAFTLFRELVAASFVEELHAHDVDGDGDTDLVAVTRGGGFGLQFGRLMTYMNQGGGLFLRRDTNLPQPLKEVVLADINDDGLLDAVVTWSPLSGSNTTALLMGSGAGLFDEPRLLEVAGAPLQLGDFTGDGKWDAAILTNAGRSNQAITIVPDVAATTPGATRVTPVFGTFQALTSKDMDDDGDLDLLGAIEAVSGSGLGIARRGIVELLLNDGGGLFRRGDPAPLGSPSSHIIAIDLNGDQRPEVVTLDAAAESLTIYQNHSIGVTNATLTVQLDRPFDRDVRVAYHTRPLTAAARLDYQSTSGEVLIAAGQTQVFVNVEVDDDRGDEPLEYLRVELTRPFNAVVADSESRLAIVDNDAQLEVVLKVTQVSARGGPVEIDVVRRDQGNVSAGLDIELSASPSSAFGSPLSLSFPPGETKITRTVILEPLSSEMVVIAATAPGFAPGQATLSVIAENPFPWRNPTRHYDVNNDGSVTPLDVLIIINFLNSQGVQTLPAPSDSRRPPPYLDSSGDGVATPIDVLLIINFLNASQSPAGEDLPNR